VSFLKKDSKADLSFSWLELPTAEWMVLYRAGIPVYAASHKPGAPNALRAWLSDKQQHMRHKHKEGQVDGLLFERWISLVERKPRRKGKGPARPPFQIDAAQSQNDGST
jgi:hypothetical protein